eukprot:CAMPEP_0113466420 /NCGR_PEP_ID=MMETSP0014_2-20120614/14261_1 /TAXON_ID=2857 /ORGANISM="Nitzschia sp." /LENGTH=37 /DNA_ID=CAMNT_0000358639 /DNA_START=20 /DNA_END=134 /DNA_ORIENTATION=- /assembly_acc=CAM_ASM_000159
MTLSSYPDHSEDEEDRDDGDNDEDDDGRRQSLLCWKA